MKRVNWWSGCTLMCYTYMIVCFPLLTASLKPQSGSFCWLVTACMPQNFFKFQRQSERKKKSFSRWEEVESKSFISPCILLFIVKFSRVENMVGKERKMGMLRWAFFPLPRTQWEQKKIKDLWVEEMSLVQRGTCELNESLTSASSLPFNTFCIRISTWNCTYN